MSPAGPLAPLPDRPATDDGLGDLGALVLRAAAQLAWNARHPREPFAERPDGLPLDRLYYRSADGWEAPLWRYPPRPGATGEPLVLVHGLGLNHHLLDFRAGQSLARAAWMRGYDVFLMEHRGDRHAFAPPGARAFDFDDIVDQDLPAALARVRELTGAPRCLWLGHAMGGQLLVGHLARQGGGSIAAGVSLCAPVRFTPPASATRLASAALQLLPGDLRIPSRQLHRALAPMGGPAAWRELGLDTGGPARRGLMLDGVEDVSLGLFRQVSRWIARGQIGDRHDSMDLLAALHGLRTPMLVLAAGGDRVCPPQAARPLVEAIGLDQARWEELDASWGHLDVLVGRRAAEQVYPLLLDFLDEHRQDCWTEEGRAPRRTGPGWR